MPRTKTTTKIKSVLHET